MCRQHMQSLSYLLEMSPGSIFRCFEKNYINKLLRRYLLLSSFPFWSNRALPPLDILGTQQTRTQVYVLHIGSLLACVPHVNGEVDFK